MTIPTSTLDHCAPNLLPSIPGAENYSLRYSANGRVFSYAHQMDAILKCQPVSVLEVGVGSGVVAAALRAIGIRVQTLDVQPELKPDILGSVTQIPVPDNSFDAAGCCQVLEHLPFEEFPSALRELRRVCGKLVLSLPDVRPHYQVSWRLPLIGQFQWTGTRRKLPTPERIERGWTDAGHFWEIGFPGYPLERVTSEIISQQWSIAREWRVPELPWHHFFLLVDKSRDGKQRKSS